MMLGRFGRELSFWDGKLNYGAMNGATIWLKGFLINCPDKMDIRVVYS